MFASLCGCASLSPSLPSFPTALLNFCAVGTYQCARWMLWNKNATERAQKCLFFFLGRKGRKTVYRQCKTVAVAKYYGFGRRSIFSTEGRVLWCFFGDQKSMGIPENKETRVFLFAEPLNPWKRKEKRTKKQGKSEKKEKKQGLEGRGTSVKNNGAYLSQKNTAKKIL